MHFPLERGCVRKSSNASVMSSALENIKHKRYFSFHLDIDVVLSTYCTHRRWKETEERTRKNAKSHFLFKYDNGDWDSGFCRIADVTITSATIVTSNPESLNEKRSKDKLQFTKPYVAVRLVYGFMGFPVFYVASSSDSGAAEETAATLVKLHTFVANTNSYFCTDCSMKVEGYRQMRYSLNISAILQIAFAQLTQ